MDHEATCEKAAAAAGRDMERMPNWFRNLAMCGDVVIREKSVAENC